MTVAEFDGNRLLRLSDDFLTGRALFAAGFSHNPAPLGVRMSAQSNIVAFPGPRTCGRTVGLDSTVNLDAIGRLWALLGQIAAL